MGNKLSPFLVIHIPCARRNPNSKSAFSGPAASRMRDAFVAMSEGKLMRFNKVVSKS